MKKENKITENILMCVLGSTYKTYFIIDFMPTWIKNNPDGEIY